MKRKYKLLILFCSIIFALVCSFTVAVVYAESIVTLEYHYNTEVALPIISYSGGVIKSESDNKVTKCDIVYDDNGTTKVLKDVDIPDSGYSCSLDVLKILPVVSIYDSKTINYKNEYIEKIEDLEITNTHKDYNNIFDYIFNNHSKELTSRTVVFINDITIDKEITLNYPCSVEIINSTITLDENLIISHSYPGVYYIDATNGSIQSNDDNKILLKAPKAEYISADAIIDCVDDAFSVDSLLDEAIEFANRAIPTYITSNLYLQSYYKNYGLKLEYSIEDNSFYGDINDYLGQEIELVVTANYKDNIKTKTITSFVVDFDTGMYVEEGLANYVEKYYYTNEDNKTYVGSFDLGVVLKEFFSNSLKAGKNLSIFVRDDSTLNINDNNSVSLVNDDVTINEEDDYYYVNLTGDISTLNMQIKKGDINIAETIDLYFAYGNTQTTTIPASPSASLAVREPSYDEIVYFLKEVAPAFLTNTYYPIFNIESDNLYVGKNSYAQLILAKRLGIKDIQCHFTGIDTANGNAILTNDEIKEMYFGDMSENYTYSLKNKAIIISTRHVLSLVYTITFDDDTQREFSLPIYRSAFGAGGDSQMFTSDNQLASYFINNEMNWLAPMNLLLSNSLYTSITVSKINGTPVNQLTDNPILNIVTLEGTNTTKVVNEPTYNIINETFYQSYNLWVNPNYVPTSNTAVTVDCYLYNDDTSSSDKVSAYSYTFIVPGIYKCLTNGYASSTNWDDYDQDLITEYTFTDSTFYNLLINLLGSEYTSNVFTKKGSTDTEVVLLSTCSTYEGNRKIDIVKQANDATGKGSITHDDGDSYLAIDFSILGNDLSIQNIDGISVFSKVQAIIFDGVEIQNNIYDFSNYDGLTLKYLSLNNCSLNDAKIFNNNVSSLSNLYINYIDLSNNNISQLDGLLLRTIQALDISDNNISNIETLKNLKDIYWLDISDNNINRFETLKEIPLLEEVFVTNNNVTDPTYGSKGDINIPVYVWIMKTNKLDLYVDGGTYLECGKGKIYGYALTDEEIIGSVALNAFASPTVLNSDEKTKLETNLQGTMSGYTFKFVDDDLAVSTTMTLYKDDGSTISSNDVCYYKVAIYSNGVLLATREFQVIWR